ncbi:MAG: sulfotransferase [Acidimicrobiia bacterium]|nr:sulfotransferase [Acidimicrobiia bacterium]
MTWPAEPRPEWLRTVNAGDVLPLRLEADRPFEREVLMGEAATALGWSLEEAPWGADDFVEPLDLWLAELEATARLTVFGRWFTRRFVLRLLQGRLLLDRYAHDDPGVADEPVVEPVFVVGAPRTGTTLTHRLLAADPRLRAPQGWELLHPVPPPTDATFEADPRIGMADRELSLPQLVSQSLLDIHAYGGRMLKECLSAMSFAFRSEELISRYHVPAYVEWLQGCDMASAYRMHRRVLQVLQRRMPGTRWVLKSPVHLHNLPTLLTVYPDARLVFTHRDPLTVLASVSSLVANLRHAFSDHVDPVAIGRYHADLYCDSLDRLVDLADSGLLPAGRTAHVAYDALAADPAAAIAGAHGQLQLTLDPAAADALAAAASAAGRDHAAAHDYRFDDFGLDRGECRARLARYADRFDVELAP